MSPRRFAAGVVLASLAFALAAGAARAEGAADYPPCNKPKPSQADLDAAKGAHKAATEFNERGEYDKAIQYWRDAYNFDCTAHALLINIANAYEKKGDKAA
ncbi:MAG TPA: hypothetical protein VHB21_08135, partial [Minicystis sp.]|nr:hypothetical protein [Minicystis sp.]